MSRQINAYDEDEATVAEHIKLSLMGRYGKEFTVLIRPNGRVRLLAGRDYPAEEFAQVVGVYTHAAPVAVIEEHVSDFLRGCAKA